MDDNLSLTRKLQLKELEILKVFQEVCKRHNLRYFAIGGTCLGAVRHKGFIPWDDDIDVAMPYEDYTKFLEIAKSELPPTYGILDFTAKHWTGDCYCKLHDTRTTLIEDDKRSFPDRYCGVFIDIFPLHGSSPNKFVQQLLSYSYYLFTSINNKIRFPFSYYTSLKSRLSWVLSYPLRLLPYDCLSIKHQNLMRRYPFGCSDKIIFPWRRPQPSREGWYTNIFPYEDFKSAFAMPFEDTIIFVPAGYDEYLRMEFGSYMQLPPEEKRVSYHSHNAIVDFERPYTYYAEKAGGNP